jgi:acyl-CoA thioesterase I
MKKIESIVIFGDSISWGAWDMEKGGWVNRLWFQVAKRKESYVQIYNQSIDGGTTETILKRFESEAEMREADALVFQTGENDAACLHEPNKFLVPPEKFKENLNEIIRKAKKITENIVFMDLKNCDESKTAPVPWADIYYTNENIQKYRRIMEEVCRENDVLFLDLKLLDDDDFDDGLHPNAQGHRKIFEQVKGFMTKNKWI